MKKDTICFSAIALMVALLATACGTTRYRRASVLEYLYPEGKEASEPEDVHLELPLNLGLAFVPESKVYERFLTPVQEQTLLERVRDAFVDTPEIERIEIIPPSFVSPAGGFDNVDQIRSALGIDLIVLVSFDQTQFDDPNLASITYWTILGAYVVKGDENETHTLVDASAFDIESRALLMNAAGKSVVKDKSTGVDIERSLREDRVEGFEKAVADLIVNLGVALEVLREQVKTGTVRGKGTPAVDVTAKAGYGGSAGGGVGVGSMGALEVGLAVLFLTLLGRRRV